MTALALLLLAVAVAWWRRRARSRRVAGWVAQYPVAKAPPWPLTHVRIVDAARREVRRG